MKFWVEVRGEIDSRELWERIKGYQVNLTDVIHKVWIYGEASVQVASEIISICAEFGDIGAKVYKGGAMDEQAQKE